MADTPALTQSSSSSWNLLAPKEMNHRLNSQRIPQESPECARNSDFLVSSACASTFPKLLESDNAYSYEWAWDQSSVDSSPLWSLTGLPVGTCCWPGEWTCSKIKLLLGYPFFLSNRVGYPYTRDRPGGTFGLLLSWPFTASQPKAFLALSFRDQTCHTTAAVASIDVLGQSGSE